MDELFNLITNYENMAAGSHSLRGIDRRSEATAELRQHQRDPGAVEI